MMVALAPGLASMMIRGCAACAASPVETCRITSGVATVRVIFKYKPSMNNAVLSNTQRR